MVRLYLASALQRLDPSARWGVAEALMAHAEDANDHNLPKMIWLGVEPLVSGNPAFALERASRSQIPLVARFIARRSVDADALGPLVDAIGRNRRKPETSLLEGMRDGLEGRFDLTPPSNWPPRLRTAQEIRRGRRAGSPGCRAAVRRHGDRAREPGSRQGRQRARSIAAAARSRR